MKILRFALLMLCTIIGVSVDGSAAPVRISGRVLYKTGAPVYHARVVFWSFGAVGSLQPITQSDENGYFSLDIQELSSGSISASKVSEGYPDAAMAFYGRSGYRSLQVIDLKTYVPNHSVELHFGEPQQTIAWTVIDSATGKPVRGARAYLQTADNPQITGSETIQEGEAFLFVLPRNPVKIRISAPGYADQTFVEQDQSDATSHSGIFSMQKRTIQLRPEGKL